MTFTLTLLYKIPAEGPDAFNLDYYLNQHLKVAREAWSGYGMKNWSVVKVAPETGYIVQTIITWESPESFGKAMKESGEKVKADRVNFAPEDPVVIAGTVTAEGTMD